MRGSEVKKNKVQEYEMGDIKVKKSYIEENKTEKNDCFENYN